MSFVLIGGVLGSLVDNTTEHKELFIIETVTEDMALPQLAGLEEAKICADDFKNTK